MLTAGVYRYSKDVLKIYIIQLAIEPQFFLSNYYLWKSSLNNNHTQNLSLAWLLSKRWSKCCYLLQQYIYPKKHFQLLPLWLPTTYLDLLCQVNCMDICQKYHQELTIYIKQGEYILLSECKYRMWFSWNIFDKFHLYLYGSLQDFIFIYMGVHEVDPEIERDPCTQKFETYGSKLSIVSPVCWGCKIHQLHLCRKVRSPVNVLDMILNNLMVRF